MSRARLLNEAVRTVDTHITLSHAPFNILIELLYLVIDTLFLAWYQHT